MPPNIDWFYLKCSSFILTYFSCLLPQFIITIWSKIPLSMDQITCQFLYMKCLTIIKEKFHLQIENSLNWDKRIGMKQNKTIQIRLIEWSFRRKIWHSSWLFSLFALRQEKLYWNCLSPTGCYEIENGESKVINISMGNPVIFLFDFNYPQNSIPFAVIHICISGIWNP